MSNTVVVALTLEHFRHLRKPLQVPIQQRDHGLRFVLPDHGTSSHRLPSTPYQYLDVAISPEVAPPGLGLGPTDEDEKVVALLDVLSGGDVLLPRSLPAVPDHVQLP